MKFYKINNTNWKSTIQGEILDIPEINRELGIDKRENKFIITDVKTGAKIIESNTKNQAIQKLLKIKDNINNLSENRENDLINQLNKLVDYDTYNRYLNIFSDTFGYDILTFSDIWIYHISKKIKLDMVRFDDFFKYESEYNNMSLKDFINMKYGENVLKVVEYFI